MWERFCRTIGAEEWLTDPAFKSAAQRLHNRDALNDAIEELLKTRTTAEWADAFNAGEVPAGSINAIDQVFADPQVIHLDLTRTVRSEALGRNIALVRNPVGLNLSPSSIARPSPECGEHTDEVLGEFGFELGEIAALRSSGII
jgi:crotonobetainyl-CoA:carnitine CoA-transferase CaiB-like acyl-CoA transferase